MQYNKNQFNKVNDKKVMRKVKKQWVVASVATLAVLGGFAVSGTLSMNQPGVVAHADPAGTPQQQGGNTQSDGSKSYSNGENRPTDSADKQNQYDATSNGFNDQLKQDKNTDSSSNANATQNKDSADYKSGQDLEKQYDQYIKQGAQDYVNKANKNTSFNEDQQKYYDASYQGAADASSQYTKDTSKQGTSSDNTNTDGTNNSYSSYSGDTSSASKSHTDAQNYSDNGVKNLSNNKNSSVSTSGSNVKITTDADTIKTNNEHINQFNNGVYADVYKYGVDYFLSDQATKDAKSGKWQGTNYSQGTSNGGSSNTKDFYDDNQAYSQNKNDVYYQSYEGTKQAINDQFQGSTYSPLNDSNIKKVDNVHYDNSYNSVVNDSKNGIAYVKTASQMNNLLYGSNSKNVNTIKAVNDLNFNEVNNAQETLWTTNTNVNINIDAQNHIVDFSGIQYKFTFGGSSDHVSINNFKTLYSSNYWGPFAANSGTIYFNNVNYVGPQMLQSTSNDVYINGNVNDYQDLGTSNTYNTPFRQNVSIDGSGNQQGLYVKNLTLGPNARFFGATSSITGGHTVELTGNLTLGKSSQMTLVPRGNGGDESGQSHSGANDGIVFTNNGAQLNIGNASVLNIMPKASNSGSIAGAIETKSGSKINIDGGTINVESNGNTYSDNRPIYLNGSYTNILNNGSLNVNATNMSNSSDGLLYTSGQTVNIANGNLNIDASDPKNSNVTLINGNVNVVNPGSNGILLSKNSNGKYITGGTLSTSTSAVNGQLYYKYNLNNDGTVTYIGTDGVEHKDPLSENQSNTLKINQAPGVYLVGPASASYDSDKKQATITGTLKVVNTNVNLSDGSIYLLGSTDNKTNSGNNNDQQQGFNDNTKYDQKILQSQVKDGYVQFTETVNDVPSKPKSINTNIKYGIQGVKISLSSPNNDGNYTNQNVDSQQFSNQDGSMKTAKYVQLSSNNNNTISDAISAAIHDIEKPNEPKQQDTDKFNKNTDGYTDNYNSVGDGYNAYRNSPGADAENSPEYQTAYKNGTVNAFKAGYQQAQNDAKTNEEKSGANDFVNGNSRKDNTPGSNYSNGYTAAQIGYSDGLHGNKDNDNTTASEAGYNIGQSAGSNASAGYNGAMNSTTPEVDKPKDKAGNTIDSGNQPAYNSYQGAAQAIKDIKSNNNDPSSVSDKSGGNADYDLSYNQAVADAKKASKAGQNAALNKDDIQYPKTTATDAIFNQAQDDTQKGYQEALNNPQPAEGSITKPNEKAGFEAGRDNQAGYQAAIKDFYQNGVDTMDKARSGSNPNNSIKGYQDTIRGLIDGKSGSSNTDNKSQVTDGNVPLYNIAHSQSVGYNDSTKSDGSIPSSSDPVAYDAYYGAQAGANTGKDIPEDVDKSSTAYKTSRDQAQYAAAQGAKEYLNKKVANGGNSDVNPNHDDDPLVQQGFNNQKAYEQGLNNQGSRSNYDGKPGEQNSYDSGKSAQSDYNQAVDGNKSDNPTNNGVNDGSAAANSGFSDAQSGNFNPNGASKYPDDANKAAQYNAAYSKAYGDASEQMKQGAQQAISDGFNGNGKKQADSKNLNDKAFNQGYDNQVAYNQGLTNKPNSNPYDNVNQKEQHDAYDAGKDAKNAIGDAGKDVASGNNEHQAQYDSGGAKDSYDGANAGYKAGANGDKPDGNIGQSAKYQSAYNQAYGTMQKSRTDGANDYFNQVNRGIEPSAARSTDTDNGINDKAHNNAFAQQQGYAAGLDGNNTNPYTTNPGPNSDQYKAFDKGNQAANKAKAGYDAVQKNPNAQPTGANDPAYDQLTTPESKEAYRAAAQALQDAKDGKTTDNSSQSNSYQMAYNNAYNQNRNAMKQGSDDALGTNGGNTDLPSGKYPSNITTNTAKSLYNQAKQDAKDGYNAGMNPNNAIDPSKKSSEFNDGYNQAKSGLAGIQAAIHNDQNAPTATTGQSQDQINASFNAAKQAIKNATADAQSGKNKPNNGQFDENAIFDGADIKPAARQVYIDTYKGAYNGYNNGLNGGSQTPDQSKDPEYATNAAYKAAYDASFKQGQNDVPTPSAPNDNGAGAAGSTDLLNNNKPKTSFDNDDQKQAYDKARVETQNGFDDAIKNAGQNANGSQYYNAGYKAAQQGLAGMGDAEKTSNPKSNGSVSYYDGFNGYNAGTEAAKRAGKLNKKALNGKDKVYSYAFNQAVKTETRRQNNQGTKAGLAAAKSGKMATNLGDRSAAYVQAYKKAFRKEFVRHTPRYVYNTKGMYLHKGTKFVKASRVKGYAKGSRAKAHVFKVEGVSFSKTGLPRYRVAGGYITASDTHVADAYYRRNETKPSERVRVIKPQGTFIYKSKNFNKKTAIKKLNKNATVRVKNVENTGSITRFYIGDGKYISSNKTIVEKTR